MADFALCTGTDCPVKTNCLRFEPNKDAARVSFRQAWFLMPPVQEGACELQIAIEAAAPLPAPEEQRE